VSSSYFAEIDELEAAVARKDMSTIPMAEVPAAVDRFDVVIGVGPSDAFIELGARPGLRAKLVLLDLAFYHQLIDSSAGAFLERGYKSERWRPVDRSIVAYSCQPESKVERDLGLIFPSPHVRWHWFNYIPLGFRYRTYYTSDRHAFDVALLGAAGRDYLTIDPEPLRGRRLLFLGQAEQAPGLDRLRAELDVTCVSRVDEDAYARLLATSRSVLLPLMPKSDNVLLSVVDAMASGVPLIASRRPGFARLGAENAPILFGDDRELSAITNDLLSDENRRAEVARRTTAFVRRHMDIHLILETILEREVL
jgi:glycosyltransferase involved in cell wall biosynthesis